MKRLSFECKSLDALTDGGLRTGDISYVWGRWNIGKSILTYQLASSCIKNFERNAMIIDTEGFWDEECSTFWFNVFKDRFGITTRPIIVTEYELLELLKMVNLKAKIGYKAKSTGTTSKLLLKELSFDDLDKSYLAKQIAKHNLGFIGIDSISVPLKATIPSEQPNYPTRASLMNPYFVRLKKLARKNDLVIFYTCHISGAQYEGDIPHGGAFHQYASKYSLLVQELTKEERDVYGPFVRAFYRWRWKTLRDVQEWRDRKSRRLQKDKMCYVKLKENYGFVDLL